MIEIFEKNGKWCYAGKDNRLVKFDTEAEAKAALGIPVVEETWYGDEEEAEDTYEA
jgi:hypothetical protein